MVLYKDTVELGMRSPETFPSTLIHALKGPLSGAVFWVSRGSGSGGFAQLWQSRIAAMIDKKVTFFVFKRLKKKVGIDACFESKGFYIFRLWYPILRG